MAKISVVELYERVQDDAKKHHAGYGSDEEFNRSLKTVELALLEFFHKQDEKNQNVTDHIAPFRKYEIVSVTETTATHGVVQLPEDYAHRTAVGMVYKENPKDCKDGTMVVPYPCYHLRNNEINLTLSDAIAKPDFAANRFYHTFRDNEIHVFPKETKAIELTYLRYPVFGQIIFTIASVNGEDVLTVDTANTKDLEWNDITFNYFRALLLLNKGIELKEAALIEISQLLKAEAA